MRMSRTERGEMMIFPTAMIALSFTAILVVMCVALTAREAWGTAAGVRWGLAAMAVIAVAGGGLALWWRWAPLPPTEPMPPREPDTASERSAVLAAYVADIVAEARLSADDRERLVDLDVRLRRQAGDAPVKPNMDLRPYVTGGFWMYDEVAMIIAEDLLHGAPRLMGWTPPDAADAAALRWFTDEFPRILDNDQRAWQRDKLAAQGPIRRGFRKIRSGSSV